MKILHIGKDGVMKRFSAADSPLYTEEIADLYMNLPEEEYIRAMPDAEHIITDAIGTISETLIAGLPKLKSIHSEGVAYNKIDVAAASAHGVLVCHSSGMNAAAVAEQAVLLMSGMLRNIAVNDRAVREGRQIAVKEGYMGAGNLAELADCTVGLVGFGDIARATAALLRAYGVQKIYYNKRSPLSAEEEARLGVCCADLNTLLAQSDIVSLHVPVSPQTEHMADDAFFAAMKPGAYFVNTARGELVDDAALLRALDSGRVAMAGLDTLSGEPVQPDHPLLRRPDLADRLLLSPHIGGITASSFRRSYAMIWEDIRTAAEGGVPARAVNPECRK